MEKYTCYECGDSNTFITKDTRLEDCYLLLCIECNSFVDIDPSESYKQKFTRLIIKEFQKPINEENKQKLTKSVISEIQKIVDAKDREHNHPLGEHWNTGEPQKRYEF